MEKNLLYAEYLSFCLKHGMTPQFNPYVYESEFIDVKDYDEFVFLVSLSHWDDLLE